MPIYYGPIYLYYLFFKKFQEKSQVWVAQWLGRGDVLRMRSELPLTEERLYGSSSAVDGKCPSCREEESA